MSERPSNMSERPSNDAAGGPLLGLAIAIVALLILAFA